MGLEHRHAGCLHGGSPGYRCASRDVTQPRSWKHVIHGGACFRESLMYAVGAQFRNYFGCNFRLALVFERDLLWFEHG